MVTTALVCLVAFVSVSQSLSYLLNKTGLDDYTVWAGAKDVAANSETNLVFIGSSHIHLGINPAVFDAEMAQRGHFSRSYNLANDGESIVEIRHSLERLFDAVPCCIKFVIAEVDFGTFGPMGATQSIRGRTFFNVSNAIRYLKYYGNSSFQPLPTMTNSKSQLKIFAGVATHYTNAGVFKFWLEQFRHHSPKNNRAKPPLRGFNPTTLTFAANLKDDAARARYRDGLAVMSDWAATPEQIAATDVISPYQFALTTSLAAYVRSKGAELVLVRPPMVGYFGVEALFIAKQKAWCPNAPLILDFGIPKEYPELFDPDNRYDADHLNQDGAEIFSRLLADRFASLLTSDVPLASRRLCNEDR